ncbi:MAG: alpha/beta hydrolase family protein, partial [Candidatus Magasanikbacteria bacterium]
MKNIKIYLLSLPLLATLILTGCAHTGDDSEPSYNSNPNTTTQEQVSQNQDEEKETQEQKPSYHPKVSLQAFSQRDFTGGNLQLKEVLRENSAYTRYYITYESEDLTISGIMNIPKGEGPFPVLILNHGYIPPEIYTVGRGLKREQDYFARNGYVVLHPDYRNHGDSTKVDNSPLNFDLDYTTDVINAVKAVKKSDRPEFDTENIGMLGHSMGGGIALNLATTHPKLIDALALYAPVSGYEWKNFRRWTLRDEGEETTETSSEAQKVLDEYGAPSTNPKFWKNVSPINFVEKIDDPVILQHGTADESVPLKWSRELNKAMKSANKEIEFYTYEGGKHEFIDYWDQFMQRNLEFF